MNFTFWGTILVVVIVCSFFEQIILGFLRLIGFYTIVEERQAKVYVLFGNIVGTLDEPGLHLLWFKMGWPAFLVVWMGQCYVRDLSLDQEYLRSTPVNSEEGAPMGIGVWYEMYVSDPVGHIFRNADPQGSLRTNVGNATVRCLSNMPLANMLENRHRMSQTVREEVSAHSKEWGYQVGSVYIRKVHFRDLQMTRQIEEKVVNRLRQVTSSIMQDGSNQVNLIASGAEREAAVEFARAAAMRPRIVGESLQEISKDPEVVASLFEILETQQILDGKADITFVPTDGSGALLSSLSAAEDASPDKKR